MLRITTQQKTDTISLIVEGRLVGPWVDELRQVSRQHQAHSAHLIVDLCALIAMDVRGHELLDELRRDGATLLCSDVMNRYLLEQMANPDGDVQQLCRPCRSFSDASERSGVDAFSPSKAS